MEYEIKYHSTNETFALFYSYLMAQTTEFNGANVSFVPIQIFESLMPEMAGSRHRGTWTLNLEP